MTPTTPQKKILVIDDEKELREAVTTALTYEGYEVHMADGGASGLMLALHEKPDLILLDINMPQMNGVEVLKKLRSDEWGKKVRVVVMTAFDDMEKIAEVVEAGGDEYLVKSGITLSEIATKVRESLASAR